MYKLSKQQPVPIRATAAAVFAVLAGFAATAAEAVEVNWDQVDGTTITTFYPGIASWDFLLGADHKQGARVIRKLTKDCAQCHIGDDGEYYISADEIISGELLTTDSEEAFEPQPIAGAPGFKPLEIKAAFDETTLHVQFKWQGAAPTASAPARLSVQVNDNIRSFAKFGCFIACHDDQAGMPKDSGANTKLYGYYTRDGESLKPQEKLDQHLAKGQFIDLWEVSITAAGLSSSDEYVLQDRLEDRNDLSVSGGYADGNYTVVISRALNTGDDKDVAMALGSVFTIGAAIHDDGNKGRKHYVSFPLSIGLSAPAALAARNLSGGAL